MKLIAAAAVLLVLLYFFASSAFCLRHVILPIAGKSLGVTVTVGDASISPFSSVDLKQLRVQTTGSEPLFTADEIRLSYHLWQILGGNIHVEEVSVNSPRLAIITNPDGTSNLDPLLKTATAGTAATAKPGKPSAPPRIDVGRVAVNSGSVRLVRLYAGGGQELTVVSNVNVALENLQNGQSGKLTLGAGMMMDNRPPAPGTNGSMQATMEGNFTFSLTPDLTPGAINGSAQLTVEGAEGAMAELAGLTGALTCDVTATNVNQVALQFQEAGAKLGEIRLSGPLDMEKMEGDLALTVSDIDRRVLSLVGAGSGIDFGGAAISSSNRIVLANGGENLLLDGKFDAAKVELSENGRPVPVVDLHADYGVAVNRADGSVLLRTLAVKGLQNQRPMLRLELSGPMQFSLASPGAGKLVPETGGNGFQSGGVETFSGR